MSFPFWSLIHCAGRFFSQLFSSLLNLVFVLFGPLLNLVGASNTKRTNPRLNPPKHPRAIKATQFDSDMDLGMGVTNIMEAMNLQGSSYGDIARSHGLSQAQSLAHADELPATGEGLAGAAADEAAIEAKEAAQPVDPAKEAEKQVHRAFMNEALDMVCSVTFPVSSLPLPCHSVPPPSRPQTPLPSRGPGTDLHPFVPVMHVSTPAGCATPWTAVRLRWRGVGPLVIHGCLMAR